MPSGIDQYILAVKFEDACYENSDLKNCNECLICLLNFEVLYILHLRNPVLLEWQNAFMFFIRIVWINGFRDTKYLIKLKKNCPLCRAKIDEKISIESNRTSPISQSPVTNGILSQTNSSKSNLYISIN